MAAPGSGSPKVPAWLTESVCYEIYPQSFADSDADGVGDLRGVTERLDYLAWLGVGTIWLNPCFASPFGDAGYDVSDYLSIAPRYGTDEDLAELVEAARRRGIAVLLDLVVGHTSDQHPWFREACSDPSAGRYIVAPAESGVSGSPGGQWAAMPGPWQGWYLPNFFPFQPALNFGYARMHPAEPWRQPVDAPGAAANRAALREIADRWLRLGVAGFRVDLASTLVKDDPGWQETARVWRELRAWLDRSYPEAVLMSEWNNPAVAIPAGFHADFYLAIGSEHGSLFNNGAGQIVPGADTAPCYFDADGAGTFEPFLTAWRRDAAAAGDAGVIALFSSDHDFNRPVCGPRTADQLGAVFTFLLTWPTLPGIHCGDEIGMRWVPNLPDTEGSQIWEGWNRAGSRTPMQWDAGSNAGFSAAPAERLYLPLDPDPDRPHVASQRADESSPLHLARRLIALRKATPALRTGGPCQVLHVGYPLVYLRGGTHLVVVNPRREPADLSLEFGRDPVPVLNMGVSAGASGVRAGGFGYGIFEL